MIMQSCWSLEPHKRPTFRKLLKELEKIKERLGSWMADASSFQSLQEDWKIEIQELFDDIKLKESVSTVSPITLDGFFYPWKEETVEGDLEPLKLAAW